jgi:uroporphyrinogen-III synthase
VRVVVTRPRGQEEELVRGLVALRHEVVHCPLLEIEPLGDEPIDVSGFDWVIVTSVNGARELRRRLVGEPMRVAAIGQATADAFGRADLVPAVATQEGLLAELPRPAGRVLFAGAEGARRLLVDELGAEFVPLYRTRELAPARPPKGDLVVLASASAARAFGRLGVDIPAVSIGPQTTEAARAAGIEVVREAPTHDVAGLLAAIGSSACSSLS